MEVITKLGSLLFESVLTVVRGAPYLCMLLVAAWLGALIFNLIYVFSGGE